MKNHLIKITLFTLITLSLNACKENTQTDPLMGLEKQVGNNISKPQTEEKNCSWCNSKLTEKTWRVFTKLKGGTKTYVYFYTTTNAIVAGPFAGGSETGPSNSEKDLFFCCLKCLHEFASSKLVNNKFEFTNVNSINPFDLGIPVNSEIPKPEDPLSSIMGSEFSDTNNPFDKYKDNKDRQGNGGGPLDSKK